MANRRRIKRSTVQSEMSCTRHRPASQHRLKLASRFQSLQFEAVPELPVSCALSGQPELNGQTLAALGATSVDHSTAAAGFHANQKAVRAGAFDLGGLVSAFHFGNPKGLSDGPPPVEVSGPLSCLPQHNQGNR